ncbi:hypothetical protein HOH45_09525 [bacterium]|jgi:tetratricopeptide (TPR) repeat protein|nr:hypothetical protein [bacterium]
MKVFIIFSFMVALVGPVLSFEKTVDNDGFGLSMVETYTGSVGSVLLSQNQDNEGDAFFDEGDGEAAAVEKKDLTDDEIGELNDLYNRAVREKNFAKQLDVLQKLPEDAISAKQNIQIAQLELFHKVEVEDKENSELFKTDGDVSKSLKVRLSGIYREAQQLYIDGEKKIARDMLIHSIYLHRRFFKAKKFLEYGFDLKVGSYKVENMESKYWNRSSISFYGGNYLSSIDDLEILTYLDRKNQEIYDRLGSSYYMSGQKKKAIGAWETSLFLVPDNEELDDLIDKTKKLLKEENEDNKRRLAERKASEKQDEETVDVETQLMRVAAKRDQAYSYAQELKAQGFSAIVEELENGKFAVKVPKSELNKGTKKEEKK